MLLVSNRP